MAPDKTTAMVLARTILPVPVDDRVTQYGRHTFWNPHSDDSLRGGTGLRAGQTTVTGAVPPQAGMQRAYSWLCLATLLMLAPACPGNIPTSTGSLLAGTHRHGTGPSVYCRRLRLLRCPATGHPRRRPDRGHHHLLPLATHRERRLFPHRLNTAKQAPTY